MQVKYRKIFEKNISKNRQQSVIDEVFKQITAIKECETFADFIRLAHVTKLVGHI